MNQLIKESKAIELFEEYLDEQPSIEIGHLLYDVSHVLKSVDPTAYQEQFNNFLDYKNLEIA